MMRVLFFNIAYMYYYKGSHENIDTLCRHQSRRMFFARGFSPKLQTFFPSIACPFSS